MKRDGIEISLGFTANVNAELAVATLQETVTVTGESPVIDTSATRVQQNFKLEQLNSIPNGRDMWALLAATPGVVMSRIDVGGNRAGTQTGYTAYGLNGQVRTSVEGINTTEGTGGAGFYYDYGSFEEVFLGVAGQGAEAATPGVQSNFLGKSGGNRFSGEFYVDGYNNSFQGSNLSEIYTRPTSQGGYGFREGSNEVLRYYDVNFNVGGPIKKDKAWWHFSWRRQFNAVEQPLFNFDQSFDTWNQNPSAKVTYQLNQNHKFIGYYQWNMKDAAEPPAASAPTPTTAIRPDDAPGVAELGVQGLSGTARLSDRAVRRSALGRLRLLRSALREQRRGLLLARHHAAGAHRRARREPDRSRSQAADRRGDLLPRHQAGQPHVQVRRRDL